LQALAAKQQQLAAESSLLEQQLVAAAGWRLELVQLRASLLERLGLFFRELQQQRQTEVEVINRTATEVGCGNEVEGGVSALGVHGCMQVCESGVGSLAAEGSAAESWGLPH
jgi:hypothetical protein